MLLSTLALSLSLTQAGETPDFSWLEGHWFANTTDVSAKKSGAICAAG